MKLKVEDFKLLSITHFLKFLGRMFCIVPVLTGHPRETASRLLNIGLPPRTSSSVRRCYKTIENAISCRKFMYKNKSPSWAPDKNSLKNTDFER